MTPTNVNKYNLLPFEYLISELIMEAENAAGRHDELSVGKLPSEHKSAIFMRALLNRQ